MDLNSATRVFSHSNDSIAVRNYVGGIKGGVFLDLSGVPASVKTLPALTIIVRNTTTDICKPLPIGSTGVYTTSGTGENEKIEAPTGTEIIGLSVSTILISSTEKGQICTPSVGVINIGEVNDKVMPFVGTKLALAKSAVKTAVPTIVFNHD